MSSGASTGTALVTLWVGIGGGLGSIARYHVGMFATRRWTSFPWGTLAVNLAGSFVLALIMALAVRDRISDTARLAFGTGVLGGFTTYSTFNYETLALAEAGHYGRAVLYVAATLSGCLVLGMAGFLLGRAVG